MEDNLKNEDDKLNKIITEKKDEISKLESQISDLETLNETKSKVESEINNLTKEKKNLDVSIFELRDKYGLYSKDMKEMSLDSKSQLIKYSWAAILSIAATITLMILLLVILTENNPSSYKLMELFDKEPNFKFYSILTIRISISAVSIFFVIILLNLSRGFISQYIKTRNRLTALRVTDFLIERIQSKDIHKLVIDDRVKLESERIKEQVQLLSDQLPKLMDLGNSPFDKTSKTESPMKILKEVKELVK